MEALLNISNLDVFRGETQILWNISLQVDEGEKVAILGSNGAGKSTLLFSIMGALPTGRGKHTFQVISFPV